MRYPGLGQGLARSNQRRKNADEATTLEGSVSELLESLLGWVWISRVRVWELIKI